jgi:peptide deformylase
MTVLPVLRMGHPVLLQVAQPVGDPTTPAIHRLAADMVETMHAEEGIGIAAPQVGQALRLIVVLPLSARPKDRAAEEVEPLVLADPVLEPVGEAMEEGLEGCLSIPGLRGEVPRFAKLRWHARDLAGQEIGGIAEGLFARVLQHEVDHLDGILYPMRMTNLRSLAFLDAVPDDAPEGGQAAAKDSGS